MIKKILLKIYNLAIVQNFIKLFICPLNIYKKNIKNFSDKNAIEIGGPSKIFDETSKIFPIYTVLKTIDNSNFSDDNFWSKLKEGETINFSKRKNIGKHIIADSSDLSKINDLSYDVLLNSHVIEHLANPFKAIFEWKRILKMNGFMVMIVPHKDNTYDNLRPVTKLEHIKNDYEKNTQEDDNTHIQEVIEMHNIKKDSTVKDINDHRERTLDNFNRRIVHHHVFDTELVAGMIDFAGYKIIDLKPVKPYHIFIIAQKINDETSINNSIFIDKSSKIYKKSPFKTDKI